ncbi:MAG: stage II sporulation protein P [Clostridia bacterium]
MKYAVVSFNFKKKSRRKKIVNNLMQRKKQSSFFKGLASHKLSALSVMLLFLILSFNFCNNIYLEYSAQTKIKSNEINCLLEQEDMSPEVLKKFEMHANPVILSETKNLQKINLNGIGINNYSSTRNLDFAQIMKNNINLDKGKDKILLYNTHTSESYNNSLKYTFSYTGTYRTTNASYNMLKIGDVLAKKLNKYNIKVDQDTTPHDYGAYENAYKRSKATIEKRLATDKYAIIIDLHRDALGDLNKGLVTEINGEKCAQLMFVVGMGTNGVYNKYALDNLSLALNITAIANANYKGLFRTMLIRNSKYNQDMNKCSLLIECGTTGNTIDEVENSMKYLSKLLNELYV